MKGKNKKKYIIAITSVALAACIAAVTGIFAWMTSTKSISKVSFQISQISCKVKMYKGLENDYNGVPDLLGVGLGAGGKTAGETSTYGKYKESETSSTWTNYTASDIYYKETYSFEYIANKSMFSSDGLEANTFSEITLDNVEPSRVYVYKFSVANEKGGTVGTLSYSFDSFDTTSTKDEDGNVTSLDASAFQCRMFTVINSSEDKSETEVAYKKYTTTTTTETDTEVTADSSGDTVITVTEDSGKITYAISATANDDGTYPVTISGLDGVTSATATVVNGDDETAYTITYGETSFSVTTTTTEWFDLLVDGTNLQQNVTINAVASASDKKDSSKSNNGDIVDIWLQIRMNPKIANAVNDDGSYVTDKIFKQSVTLPYFKITFKS